MKLESRIVVYSQNETEKKCLKIIKGLLYNATINQVIRILHEGTCFKCIVVGVNDSIYDDAIYRYVEVFMIE